MTSSSRCLLPSFCIILSRQSSLNAFDVLTPNRISVMEKTKNQWRIVAPDYEPTHPCLSCLDLSCCPCGGYSRMATHVKSVTSEAPIVVAHEDGFWTGDCFKFLACLPFYSCLIGRLQKNFRGVYNIDGRSYMDCLQGCCCPAGAVSRMEVEATLREEEQRLVRGLPSILEETGSDISVPEPYKNTISMVYPKPVIDQLKESVDQKVPPPIRKSTSRSHPPDHDVAILAPIPEGAAAATVLDIEAASPAKPQRQHSLADDSQVTVASGRRNWPLLKYLGQK